jgi:hypothetical protein
MLVIIHPPPQPPLTTTTIKHITGQWVRELLPGPILPTPRPKEFHFEGVGCVRRIQDLDVLLAGMRDILFVAMVLYNILTKHPILQNQEERYC